jgi:hypothetical protein
MKERSTGQPKLSESTRAEKAARGNRLAAEMRKNLMKRKQLQRQKSETSPNPVEKKDAPDGSDELT